MGDILSFICAFPCTFLMVGELFFLIVQNKKAVGLFGGAAIVSALASVGRSGGKLNCGLILIGFLSIVIFILCYAVLSTIW